MKENNKLNINMKGEFNIPHLNVKSKNKNKKGIIRNIKGL